MSTPTKLRPGLQFYPDAETYDESMRDLRGRLGRVPTEDDVARDLWPAFAFEAAGRPCIACGATKANGAAAWRPGDVDSLVGYASCSSCRAAHDEGGEDLDRAVEALRLVETVGAAVDSIGELTGDRLRGIRDEAQRRGDGDTADVCAAALADPALQSRIIKALTAAWVETVATSGPPLDLAT